MAWSVPPEWEGETCFILGGGESLKDFDAAALRGKGRVIAINEAGLSMAPWADVLYWADHRWLAWNRERLGEHIGRYKISRHAPRFKTGHDVKVLPFTKAALSEDRSRLSGFCSGGASICLAYLFGARRIVLLGFDMGGGNWHGRHKKATDQKRFKTHFIPPIARMAGPLRAKGIEVLNATPGSALKCFPMVRLEDVLNGIDEPPIEAFAGLDVQADGVVQTTQIMGLEMTPRRRIERAIERLSDHRRAIVVVRTAGADVVTRRSADWWQTKLYMAFPFVSEEPAGPGEARFSCRKP